MDKFLSFTHINILYIDLIDNHWALLTRILDNGALYVSTCMCMCHLCKYLYVYVSRQLDASQKSLSIEYS